MMDERVGDGPETDNSVIARVVWDELRQGIGWQDDAAAQLRFKNGEALEAYMHSQLEHGTESKGSVEYRFIMAHLHGLTHDRFVAEMQKAALLARTDPDDRIIQTKSQPQVPPSLIRFRMKGETPEAVFARAIEKLQQHITLSHEELGLLEQKRATKPHQARGLLGRQNRNAMHLFLVLERIAELRSQLKNTGVDRWPTFDEIARDMAVTSGQAMHYLRKNLPRRLYDAIITRRDRKGRTPEA